MHGLVCMNTGAMLIAKTALRSQNLMQSKADHWRASMISPPLMVPADVPTPGIGLLLACVWDREVLKRITQHFGICQLLMA